MYQKPLTVNSEINRALEPESSIVSAEDVATNPDWLPHRVNSEHNRGVDGLLAETDWPVVEVPDKWNDGIDHVTVNSDDVIAAKDSRLNKTVRNMWEL